MQLSNSTLKPHVETQKTCLIYSSGGHYAETMRSIKGITFTNFYHVTFGIGRDNEQVDRVSRRYFITHPRRRILFLLKNIYESFFLLLRERPKLIISTGADVAVPSIIMGKIFFRCRVIFIESAGDVKPTLTGRIVYPFTDLFIVQWPEKMDYFPKAILSEGLLL